MASGAHLAGRGVGHTHDGCGPQAAGALERQGGGGGPAAML